MSVIIKAELRESPADNSHEGDVVCCPVCLAACATSCS